MVGAERGCTGLFRNGHPRNSLVHEGHYWALWKPHGAMARGSKFCELWGASSHRSLQVIYQLVSGALVKESSENFAAGPT